MTDSILISEAPRGLYPAITAFYERGGYYHDLSRDDRLLVAHAGGALVGAVRLRAEQDVTVLRGMQTHRKATM